MLFRSLRISRGQGLTEYAVVLSLVAVAAIGVMAFFGSNIKGKVAQLSGAVAGDQGIITKGQDAMKKHNGDAVKRAEAINSMAGNENDLYQAREGGAH